MRWLRLLLLALVALLGLLQYRLWFGNGGRQAVEVLDARVQEQGRQNEGLGQRNAALAAEVADLKSGEAAIEERARNELGMIRPGETFYRVVDDARTAPAPPPEAEQGEAP
ncbi:cell division protein FtsB [Luteimonas composti]|uniref:Cell division protein FtsB n=1 Tax=Luteimonas composti TaxID=398257 RepID=A0ABT6MN43_9GAMM|nr:cell division protein FtsB [Luteimonas composti]MDH7452006.1 cell division protein FtsB [Luteimonas composti]